MSNCKYNVGDHVVVEKSNIDDDIRNSFGKTGKVLEYWKTPGGFDYYVEFDENGTRLWCDVKCLVHKREQIVITHDGKTTTATLYEDGKKVKTATAKCAPEDTFDFMVGAKIATERLSPKTVEPPKPTYYNGKVVCIKNTFGDDDFTVGKVYEIVDGKFTDNDGNIRPAINQLVHSLSDLTDEHNDYFSEWRYKFIPFVED